MHQSIIWLILSIVSFATFFSMGYTSNYTTLPEIVNFHLLGFTGSCMILGIGFILNQITSTINYNVSIGTMVILGIHWMFIGVFNFAIEKYLHIDNITYSTFIAFYYKSTYYSNQLSTHYILQEAYPSTVRKNPHTKIAFICP
mgnify:CR=1 FL=1